jgi:hypothetical protein
MKKLLPFVLLALSCSLSHSQSVLNNNPPSLRWYQVNTPHFRVVFPKGFDVQAQRMANTLESIHDAEAKSMGSSPKKISIILQNQSAISNGFVSMLPRRSEFYGMPSQDYNFAGTNDWLDLLASHEYRHIVQYQHAFRGFNKVFYYMFGATTYAGMAQAAAPDWFWEGDAVVTETAFTPSGRGKIPYFGLAFRTNLLEGRTFNYHKQYLRSYKHHIPDEYVLGFHMVSYLRKRTNDPEIWGKVTARAWNVPFIPFAFSNALKKETGLYVTQLYREMAKDFQKEWDHKLSNMLLTPFENVTTPTIRRARAYTDYRFPQMMEDGSILALKSGIGDIATFVRIKDGKEKKVFVPGLMNESGTLSIANGVIVWNEYGFDPRWGIKSFSQVKAYDLKSKKRKRVSNKESRLGGASITVDGKIATVRTDTEYKTQLLVIDYKTGHTLQEFANPDNDFYSMPRWSPDGTRIVLLKTSAKGRSVCLADYASGTITELFPPSQENIGYPVLYGDYLLYNSPLTGIDNIYALKIAAGEKFQVTSSRYGAYNPNVSPDGKYIYYNDQTRNGLDIVRAPFTPETWTAINPQEKAPNLYDHLVEQEGHGNLFRNVPQQAYAVRKFSKAKGLINPYNWGFNVDSDLTQASVGISSRDILSTTELSAGYVFDINERTGAWTARASYQGLLPIIDVSASYVTRSVNEGSAQFYDTLNTPTTVYSKDVIFKWKEKNISAGLRIPLTLTSSKYLSNLTIGNTVGLSHIFDFKNNIDQGGRLIPVTDSTAYFFRDYADNGNLISNHVSLSAYRLMKQSRRDINSKFGQVISVNYYNTPFKGDFKGSLFSFVGTLYFPGVVKHHSLWGYWAYQKTEYAQVVDNYVFRNRIPLPRGHSLFRFQNFYSMSANYTLPVWYPDIAIGPLLNIQRLRANGFIDYGFGKSDLYRISQTYTSVGIEARLDINIMRFFPQFDIGVRFTQGLQPQTQQFELLIGTFNF